MYFKGSQVDFQNYHAFLSMMGVLILANSTDTDVMQPHIAFDKMQKFAAFYLGLY